MSLCRSCSGRCVCTLLVMALLVMAIGLVQPTTALASDGEEGTTGFSAGLDTLLSPDTESQVESDPVRDYEYEPVLRETETVEVEESTPMEGLSSVITACNGVQAFGSAKYSLLDSIIRMFTLGVVKSWFATAIGFVFLWWGVRLTIRMIMGSFKRGKLSLGGRESVAPQGWSTRDLDKWRDF